MSIDPDLRIALGFILLLRMGLGIFYTGLTDIGIFAELRRVDREHPWLRRAVWGLLIGPLLPFLADADGIVRLLYWLSPTAADFSIIRLPDTLRLLLLVPAVAGLLLVIWSRHAAISPAELDVAAERAGEPNRRFLTGPFRSLRFPQWLGDLLLFGSLALATDNWGAVIMFSAACLVLRAWYLPQAELAWQRLLGDGYGEYAGRAGSILPRIPASDGQANGHYSVPKRFGISAIIGLTTMFAVIFGGINLLQTWITEFQLSPTWHLFFGLQLMAIWIGQMRFGHSPRRVSALVGAFLLPVFVLVRVGPIPVNRLAVICLVLAGLGAVIGYCLGAMAAGLFLVMEWLGPYLPGSRKSVS